MKTSFYAALIALSALASPAHSADAVRIEVLSNRADLISGGDALVAVSTAAGVDRSALRVTAGGRDVTGAFAVRADGRFLGRIEGLALGENLVTAQLPDGRGARIVITNHPVGGPIFSGAQIQPWLCSTEAAGLGPAMDAQCNAATTYQFFYVPSGGGGFKPYDPANPPADVGSTTTDQGHTVPYIIREETGTANRGIYRIAVLYDPTQPFEPWAVQRGWNRKLYYLFGASCGTSHTQSAPENVRNGRALSRGFAVASSSMNVLGTNCNTVSSAESVMMLKERIVERYGEIRYTMGKGGSGGSIGQHVVTNAYPGLVDGIVPEMSYEDVWSAVAEVNDCHLLVNYFTRTSPYLWADPQQQAAVTGHLSIASCVAWEASFAPVSDPRNGCNAGPGTDYDPQSNPGGCRGTLQDFHMPQLGPRREDGFAQWPYDNVGRMYGLVALRKGLIAPEQFVDLNEKIGGVDIDNNFVPGRKAADPGSVEILHRSGLVNDGRRLNRVPIIDVRPVAGDAEIHTGFHSFAMRERLKKAHGHADNHVIFQVTEVPNLPSDVGITTFTLMDRWLSAIEADTESVPLETKVVRNKPAEARDTCIVQNQFITDPAVCAAAFPHYADPLIASGGPASNDVMKCRLKPLEPADVLSPVPFTLAQYARLLAVFPDGVCDWGQPGADQVPSEPWVSFAGGPGGRALGNPPQSIAFGPPPRADIFVSMSDSPDPVRRDNELTYAITVGNAGPDPAADVGVVDQLPKSVHLVSVRSSQGGCAATATEVRCALGALQAGASAGVQIVVRPRNAGTLSNSATATASTADPAPQNNGATAVTLVTGGDPL